MSVPVSPLTGISVVDFGLGAPPAIAVRLFVDAGARVSRAEPHAGDPFYRLHPSYETWHRDKAIVRASDIAGAIEAMDAELSTADLCVIGGEDHPGLDWLPDAAELSRRYPRLVILKISGAPMGDLPASELLAQARSGIVFEQHPDRPMVWALPVGTYGAALQGAIGAAAALVERESSGHGQTVTTSLFEGTLSWLGCFWFRSDRSDAAMRFELPPGAQPLIFRCSDGKAIHFSFGTGTARADVYAILGIDDPTVATDPRGLPSPARGLRNFFGDIDLLQSHIDHWTREDLLQRLWAVGVPAEPVNLPGEGWEDDQVRHNGLIQTDTAGTRRVGLPFRVRLHEDNAPRTQRKSGAPLQGVKVVDLGSFTAGPHASMALKDLGADIIKIEPLAGDPFRGFFRPFTTSSRGKRSMALDLKHPAGLEVALKLCARADMVHHNFRPGVTKRLGIGPEVLRKLNPNVILLDNSGYGPDGPHAARGGFDMVFQAFCGHEIRGAGVGNDPLCYRLTTIDITAGLLGTFASLLGELSLRRHGLGSDLSTSLLNAGLFLLSELTRSADGSCVALPELDRDQLGFHPAERLYKTRDGWIALVIRTDEMARKLAKFLGAADRLASPLTAWGEEEARVLTELLGGSATTIARELAAIGVWAEACNPDAAGTYLFDPALVERGTVVISQDSRYGEMRQIGTLFSLGRMPNRPDGTSALLGAHTREVLAELGYSQGEIDRLYEMNVVR
jgi:crotonobetainyl-CoA:carnitine CoA-transferase CaiB-like acyl-CoA transferase